jgi:succinate dehydrogenase/fumarate reductase flavoprotein subunit
MSTESVEPQAEEPDVGLTPEQESFAEQALANLLEGPYDKVSITMPSALRERIAARAVDKNFSAYVTEVLEREERRRSLKDFLDYMDELYGPPTEEEMAKTDKEIEEMWARYEDYLSQQSSSMRPRSPLSPTTDPRFGACCGAGQTRASTSLSQRRH